MQFQKLFDEIVAYIVRNEMHKGEDFSIPLPAAKTNTERQEELMLKRHLHQNGVGSTLTVGTGSRRCLSFVIPPELDCNALQPPTPEPEMACA